MPSEGHAGRRAAARGNALKASSQDGAFWPRLWVTEIGSNRSPVIRKVRPLFLTPKMHEEKRRENQCGDHIGCPKHEEKRRRKPGTVDHIKFPRVLRRNSWNDEHLAMDICIE